MDALLDIFDLFNMLDKAEGALAGLLNFERGTHGKRLQKRGMVTLFLPRELGKSGAEAEQYLKRFGIPVHGRSVRSDGFRFLVPSQQAEWARVLLERWETPQQPKAWADSVRCNAR